MERMMVRLVLCAAIAAVPTAAMAGTTTYDMSSILFSEHPFAATEPLPPVVAGPLPLRRSRAPAAGPQAIPSSRAAPRPAAPEPIPPETARRVAAVEPAAGGGVRSVLSEIRVGLLAHDQGPFSSNEEDGIDGNVELLFVSPSFLDIVWSPRPHVGLTVNSGGDTSQIYAGLSWEWSFWSNWFAGFSLGGSVHDGETKTNRVDRKELGCHLLFRESVEIGYRFGGRHGVSAFLDHISNANICDKNEGLETTGIRYGYRF